MTDRRTFVAALGAVVLVLAGGIGNRVLDEPATTTATASTTIPTTSSAPTTTTTAAATSTTTTIPTTTTTRPPTPAEVAQEYVTALARLDDDTAHAMLCQRRRDAISLEAFSQSIAQLRRERGLRSGTVKSVFEQEGQVLVEMSVHYGASALADVYLVPEAEGWRICDMVGFDIALDLIWPPEFGGRRQLGGG